MVIVKFVYIGHNGFTCIPIQTKLHYQTYINLISVTIWSKIVIGQLKKQLKIPVKLREFVCTYTPDIGVLFYLPKLQFCIQYVCIGSFNNAIH